MPHTVVQIIKSNQIKLYFRNAYIYMNKILQYRGGPEVRKLSGGPPLENKSSAITIQQAVKNTLYELNKEWLKFHNNKARKVLCNSKWYSE